MDQEALTVEALGAGGLPHPGAGVVGSQLERLDGGSDVVHGRLWQVSRRVSNLDLPHTTLEVWRKNERREEGGGRGQEGERSESGQTHNVYTYITLYTCT